MRLLIAAVVEGGNRRNRCRDVGLSRGSKDCPSPAKKENRVKSSEIEEADARCRLKACFPFSPAPRKESQSPFACFSCFLGQRVDLVGHCFCVVDQGRKIQSRNQTSFSMNGLHEATVFKKVLSHVSVLFETLDQLLSAPCLATGKVPMKQTAKHYPSQLFVFALGIFFETPADHTQPLTRKETNLRKLFGIPTEAARKKRNTVLSVNVRLLP
ncbi:hypothetical protein [Brevibacillus parabrevis]|uniref:hypothetical protein n=1 Tax=Brevibacillus parabrevis TaxID=54914 RepID=UPI002E1AAC4F|nr:hypothetical protein [Brevibacillus parabrevis]